MSNKKLPNANRIFCLSFIKNIMQRNYQVKPDLLPLNELIDETLTPAENWYNIKPKVLLLCTKQNKHRFSKD